MRSLANNKRNSAMNLSNYGKSNSIVLNGEKRAKKDDKVKDTPKDVEKKEKKIKKKKEKIVKKDKVKEKVKKDVKEKEKEKVKEKGSSGEEIISESEAKIIEFLTGECDINYSAAAKKEKPNTWFGTQKRATTKRVTSSSNLKKSMLEDEIQVDDFLSTLRVDRSVTQPPSLEPPKPPPRLETRSVTHSVDISSLNLTFTKKNRSSFLAAFKKVEK